MDYGIQVNRMKVTESGKIDSNTCYCRLGEQITNACDLV